MTILLSSFFFFNDTATTEIYTLSLHDALPICKSAVGRLVAEQLHAGFVDIDAIVERRLGASVVSFDLDRDSVDRKSTRLNSSHLVISYAVFCLKKKKKNKKY